MAQLFFEDIPTFYSLDTQCRARLITQSDINTFADCTGDYNPIHVSPDKVNKNSFLWRFIAREKPIAHGLLTISTAVGLLNGYDLLDSNLLSEIRGIKFVKPVWPGNRIYAKLAVMVKKTPDKDCFGNEYSDGVKRRFGELVCDLKVFNQAHELVARMDVSLFVERRQALEKT